MARFLHMKTVLIFYMSEQVFLTDPVVAELVSSLAHCVSLNEALKEDPVETYHLLTSSSNTGSLNWF